MALNLKSKSGTELRSHLKSLRGREKELIVEILNHLKEVEARKLYLQWGYSSMYEFRLQELGYSKDEAYIRIQGMRALSAVPEIAEKVKDGSITLSVLAKSQIAFNRENQKRREEKLPALTVTEKVEVLKAVEKSSARECDRALATFFPETKVRPELTKPVSAKETLIQFTADEVLLAKFEKLKGLIAHKSYNGSWEGLFSELADLALKKLDKSATESVRKPGRSVTAAAKEMTTTGTATVDSNANANAKPAAAMRAEQWLSSRQRSAVKSSNLVVTEQNEFVLEMRLSSTKQETLGSNHNSVVTKRKAFASKTKPISAATAQKSFVLEQSSLAVDEKPIVTGANAVVTKRGALRQSSNSNSHLNPGSRPSPYRKYISVHIKRAVWRNAQGACQYIDASTGKRCNSRHALQLDHVKPLALGGSDDISNLRLLCGAHNRYLAIKGLG